MQAGSELSGELGVRTGRKNLRMSQGNHQNMPHRFTQDL